MLCVVESRIMFFFRSKVLDLNFFSLWCYSKFLICPSVYLCILCFQEYSVNTIGILSFNFYLSINQLLSGRAGGPRISCLADREAHTLQYILQRLIKKRLTASEKERERENIIEKKRKERENERENH